MSRMNKKATSKKNYYRSIRDKVDYSREDVEKLTNGNVTVDILKNIESGKKVPDSEEVIALADTYNAPEICNHYCVNECRIGDRYVLSVGDISKLHTVIIQLLNSLNRIDDMEKTLIDIVADNKIDNTEIGKLVDIQVKFEDLAKMIRALQLCVDRKIGEGEIDKKLYDKAYNKIMKDINL